ncbi:hypothetical protein [Alteromonas sp. 14N.309.X.WAT.G.H12]|uniref:hypothetical protein n=1 Tax=Alteromonas sp. 14N.309.X.WAT.G.H12 TaxID=3120824 RepID=UPI002FD51A0B
MKLRIGLAFVVIIGVNVSVACAADRGRNMDVLTIDTTPKTATDIRPLQDTIYTQPLYLLRSDNIDSSLVRFDKSGALVMTAKDSEDNRMGYRSPTKAPAKKHH